MILFDCRESRRAIVFNRPINHISPKDQPHPAMANPNENVPRHRREKFLPEEDAKLRELVQAHGSNAWDEVAKAMPGRNPRQCRERWKHYLSSEKNNSQWTPDEDRLLFEKMEEHGPKWTTLLQFFPGRTDMQLKSRWMQKFAATSQLHLKNRVLPANYNFSPMQMASPSMPSVIPAFLVWPPGYPCFPLPRAPHSRM
jgi:hypothetical protein